MRFGETLGAFAALILLAAACNSGGQGTAERVTTPTAAARQTAVTQQPSPVPSHISLPGESCEMVEAYPRPLGIYVIDPESCEVAQVTDGQSDRDFAWSPDGKQLAFVRLESPSLEANADLFVVNSDGSGLHQLTRTEGEQESAPAWSPDGSTIAFATLSLEQIEYSPGEGLNEEEWAYDLKVLAVANTQNVKTLVVAAFGHLEYDWSPDSRQLAVVASRERSPFVVDVASGELRELAADAVPFGHEWSPDGMRMMYRCREKGGTEPHGDVCVISRDGSNHVVIAHERYFGSSPDGSSEIRVADIASLSWTPDGRHVVFAGFAGTGRKLYFVDPEDGRLDRVVDNWRGEHEITWLSERVVSAHICTGEVVPCSWETIVVDLATSEWRSLLRESCFYSSRWSPDGRLLAFALGDYGVGCA